MPRHKGTRKTSSLGFLIRMVKPSLSVALLVTAVAFFVSPNPSPAETKVIPKPTPPPGMPIPPIHPGYEHPPEVPGGADSLPICEDELAAAPGPITIDPSVPSPAPPCRSLPGKPAPPEVQHFPSPLTPEHYRLLEGTRPQSGMKMLEPTPSPGLSGSASLPHK